MLPADELYALDDESDYDGSGSGSAGMCTFTFRFRYSVGRVEDSVGRVDNSVVSVCVVGSGVLVLTVIESIGDIVQ